MGARRKHPAFHGHVAGTVVEVVPCGRVGSPECDSQAGAGTARIPSRRSFLTILRGH
jgi:hypothetical protein